MADNLYYGVDQLAYHKASVRTFLNLAATSILAKLFRITNTGTAPAGTETYTVQPFVVDGLPEALSNLFSEPDYTVQRSLATTSGTMSRYLKVYRESMAAWARRVSNRVVMPDGEVRYPSIEMLFTKLNQLSLRALIRDLITAWSAAFSASGAFKVSAANSGSAEALCATHTMADGTTYANNGTPGIDQDEIAGALETCKSEKGPDGLETYAWLESNDPILAISQSIWVETTAAVNIAPGATSVNIAALGIKEENVIVLPGLTSGYWFLSMGARDDGPTVVFDGQLTDADLPPEMRGQGFVMDGRPGVGHPKEIGFGQGIAIPYGYTGTFVASSWEGIWGSNGTT